jgi:hypothetical protein
MRLTVHIAGFVIAGLAAPFPSWQWLAVMTACSLVYLASIMEDK